MIDDRCSALSVEDLRKISGGTGTVYRNEPYRRYQIEFGDTLSELAIRYNTSVAVLCQINGISDPNKILAGNVLLIPTKE